MKPSSDFYIRPASPNDLSAILAIYNDAVLTTTATYDVEPRTLEHRAAWFEDHQRANLPIFVVVGADEQVVGWSTLNLKTAVGVLVKGGK